MDIIVAAGLGGGSLVYTNVHKRAHSKLFEKGWPEEITALELDQYYQRVAQMLGVGTVPEDFKRSHLRLSLLEEAVREDPKSVYQTKKVEKASLAVRFGREGEDFVNEYGAVQRGCNGCGMCIAGCREGAKNTLDLNYLKVAENSGAEIVTEHEAIAIEQDGRGYKVICRRTKELDQVVFYADKVVLAAGTLGTNRLLLRCKHLYKTLPRISDRLGENFSANADLFAALLGTSRKIEQSGTSVSALADYWPKDEFLILEGILPTALPKQIQLPIFWLTLLFDYSKQVRNFFRSLGRRPLLKTISDRQTLLSHVALLFLMGKDASNGSLKIDKQGDLQLEWSNQQSLILIRKMVGAAQEIAKRLDSWLVVNPAWWLKRRLSTVHPLGGAAMADSRDLGVVSASGEVFGYPGLYVADGAIIPSALGVPPSATIAALAERISDKIIGLLDK
ncbi:MAG: GMC family oxidoreductase [Blastocatellia bacterium]|nr:GMC family oxidoreductase [Blastocatellia bacterium]